MSQPFMERSDHDDAAAPASTTAVLVLAVFSIGAAALGILLFRLSSELLEAVSVGWLVVKRFFSSLLQLLYSEGKGGPTTRRLPPGSMGLPYIGETFQLYSSKNPNTFFSQKQKRYGPVFKTRILGCPCVMMSSPEASKFVLVSKAHLFKPTFPSSKERMLGRQAIFFQQGEYHALLRRLVLRAVSPEAIRAKISDIEVLAVDTLHSWNHRQPRPEGVVINTYQEMKTYALNVALLSIFGNTAKPSSPSSDYVNIVEELKQCYYTLEKGYNSMPINLPGTLFHKAIKARGRLSQILYGILRQRRNQMERETAGGHTKNNHPDEDPKDLLSSLMRSSPQLTDDQIADNIIGVIFAARDTTASVLTWIFKFLADHPDILQAVTDEQEEIVRRRLDQQQHQVGMDVYPTDGDGPTVRTPCGTVGLTWADTKRMPVTSMVIQETMRVASIISFTFREAVEDVEYQGYIIPKGWKVMPLFRNIHHSSDHFHCPDKFDPWRFQVPPKPNTFVPFGSGAHSCPGNELAKLEILVFLHHLTMRYRWSPLTSSGGIQFDPFTLPANGLPIMFFSRKENNVAIKCM